MKRLLLLRHAKSSWDDESMEDHERPLNDRGRRDAPRMGQVILGIDPTVEWVVCSTAKRACETLEGLGLSDSAAPEIVYEDRLYHAPPSVVRSLLRAIPDRNDTALLIGHNPGMEELASEFAGEYLRMPTATLLRLDFDLRSWTDLDAGARADSCQVWRPKELPDR